MSTDSFYLNIFLKNMTYWVEAGCA